MSELPDYLRDAPALTADEVAGILRFIPRPPREDWIKLISACVATLGESEALPVLTAQFPDEKPNETAAVIRSLHGAPRSDAGTLIYFAKQNGFDASAFFKDRAARLKADAGTRPAAARNEKTKTPRRERRGNANPAAASDVPAAPVKLGECSICESPRKPETATGTRLRDVLKAIKAGKWSKEIAAVRAGTRDKSTLPQCCAFGVYRERRADENLASRSGFLVLDYDGADNPKTDFAKLKERLAQLPFTLAAFTSPSGNGLKAVIRVPDNVSDAAALAAAQTLLAPLGGKIDAQAAARKHFIVSSDAGAYVNAATLDEIPPLPASFDNLSRDALGVIFAETIERFFFAGKETYFFDELDGLPYKELSVSAAAEEFTEAHGVERKTARRILGAIRKQRHVSAVFPALTCRRRGMHAVREIGENGKPETTKRILVLESTRPIYPEEGGAFPIWKKMFETVFAGETEQLRRLLAWLFFAVKRYHEAVESEGERIQPVPALLLLGLAGSGKTLLAESLRMLLGNRAAGNMKNFILERPWLGDIIGSECVFGSESRNLKPDERAALKSTMKEVMSGEGYFAESKNKAGFMFRAQHFLIHMANNEENGNCAASCPAMDEDFKDKCLAFATANVGGVKAAFPKRDEEKNRKLFREQAPAFLYWLFTYYAETIPEDWTDERFGVKHYEAPAATRSLFEVGLANELHGKLIEMLKENFDTDFRDKKFTSTKISEKIANRFGGKPIYSGTLGKAMNELCEKFPQIYFKAARNQYGFHRPPENAAALLPAVEAANGAGTPEAAQEESPFAGLPF